MLLPRRLSLAAVITILFALPAEGQSASGRASVLAQARVVEPALATVSFEATDVTATSAERRDAERRPQHLVVSGITGASFGVALREGSTTIVVVRLHLGPEPRRISMPAPVHSRPRGSVDPPLIVELVHLGL